MQAVDRAMLLLKAVARSSEPPTVHELARACGLNRSTAWRLLATLERHGLVERDPRVQRYSVGYAAISIGATVEEASLARRLRPVLSDFARRIGETVTLAAAKRFTLVYIDQVEAPNQLAPSWLDRPMPLHATSGGKAFLAWLPKREREAALPSELPAYTPQTITDRAVLDEELEVARRVGYATAVGEYELFSNGVASAALDERGRPLAVVNVWGPEQRIGPDRFESLGQAAIEVAREIPALLR